MSLLKFSKVWVENYSSRSSRFSMKGKLIGNPAPVGSMICMCPEVEDIRPLKVPSNIYINWETGLFHHKSDSCDKPLPSMVQNCNGCFEDFWGYSTHIACDECLPLM